MENLRYNLTKTLTSRCARPPLKPDAHFNSAQYLRYNLIRTFTSRCARPPLKPNKKVTDLEVVEGLHLPADGVQLGVVLGLDVSDGLGKLVLPELAVLRCGVAVGKSSQFLQLLCMDTASVLLSHFLECKVHMERVSGLARSRPRDKSVLVSLYPRQQDTQLRTNVP